jgi:hypothetical protein
MESPKARMAVEPTQTDGSIGDAEIANRFGYHKATETTGPIHQDIRGAFTEMGKLLDRLLPEGRAKSTCFTELENASMWANKAVAELAPIVYE